jgi:hypothetical protein
MRDDHLASEQVSAMAGVVCGNHRVVIGDGIVHVLRKLYVVLSVLNKQFTKGEELLMVS